MERLGVAVAGTRLLEDGDGHYYRHKNGAELPVYRVILDDSERMRLYVTSVTGSIWGIDATARASRWLRVGRHDLDFAAYESGRSGISSSACRWPASRRAQSARGLR